MNSRIAKATQKQKDVVADIKHKVDSISNVSMQTAKDAINTSKSSHELSLMSGQLKGLVRTFLLDEENETNALAQTASDDSNDELF